MQDPSDGRGGRCGEVEGREREEMGVEEKEGKGESREGEGGEISRGDRQNVEEGRE